MYSYASYRTESSSQSNELPPGLYYYAYRYYDPVTGRWIKRDPIEENGGPSLYGFNFNEPISWVDDLGHKPHKGNKSKRDAEARARDHEEWKQRKADEEQAESIPTAETDIGDGGKVLDFDGLRNGSSGDITIESWFLSTTGKACHPGQDCGKLVWKTKKMIVARRVSGTSVLHEQAHLDDARKVWSEAVARVEKYLNKCMSKKKATCYHQITPKIQGWSKSRYNRITHQMHIDGRTLSNGQVIGREHGLQLKIAKRDIKSAARAEKNLDNQIKTMMKKCDSMP